jgi:hypothetical protein
VPHVVQHDPLHSGAVDKQQEGGAVTAGTLIVTEGAMTK